MYQKAENKQPFCELFDGCFSHTLSC